MMEGSLILVPTPIGNLGDISPRAVDALKNADFIAAEDTRVSLRLLNHLEIKKTLISYHENNKLKSGPQILSRLQAGETCALVTDAGTPAISDPGEDLVRLCADHGIAVTAVPGPCAAITALAISGLPTGRFTFEGFLSINKRSRREHLDGLLTEHRTMIFYEAPHKLIATLNDMAKTFGPDRRITLCRELTKLHEEALRMTLGQAQEYYTQKEPRGEYVLIIEGAPAAEDSAPDMDACVAQVLSLKDKGLSLKDAVKQVSKDTGVAKNILYDAALQASRDA